VYATVSFSLLAQVDQSLSRTATEIIENTHTDSSGQLVVPTVPFIDLPTDVFMQAWGRYNRLLAVSPPNLAINRPLDPRGLTSNVPVFRNVIFGDVPLRIFTVPLVAGQRSVGTLQIGTRLSVVVTTQRILLTVLIAGAIAAILVTFLAAWLSTNRALAPLEGVTQAALQITRADDLSRRIPYRGPPGDEIGQLIQAFNQTLSRLESLFHAQRRFMADVGHELRTPLTVIKGNVALLRRIGTTDQESLGSIESEVDRLTRLVGDLLLLAQAESGKLPLDRRLVEVDTLLLEALQQMSVLARDRLTLRLGEIDQVLVMGDQDRLKQVIVNLVGNAITYTPPGGEVVVSLGKVGSQGRFIVSDNGPGIPAGDLPHIFERFYRGEKSRTRPRDGKGFGLGLSIAYWIVRNHGGRIEVDSTEGKGTTFCVWLPLADEK
jgi:signal transduction histidine kinase